jgi:hypothetical protein
LINEGRNLLRLCNLRTLYNVDNEAVKASDLTSFIVKPLDSLDARLIFSA